jgi:4-hydroxymandelate oxidase
VLVDVSRRSLDREILGERIEMPVLVAPMAFQRLAHADGELATASAAGDAGTIMILSCLSTSDVEDVVRATTAPVWFQLYVYRDRAATESVIARAEAAGCRAIVLTVDAPILGSRERDVRNRFHLPSGLYARNLVAEGYGVVGAAPNDSGLAAYASSFLDPSLSWKDLDWLSAKTKLPLVIKGILRKDDAIRAADHGARAIVVSNHGGRQLDTAPAAIDVVSGIKDAVRDRLPVLMDGGIRRGTDVLKAIARGADAVLLGRPILWGLAVGGRLGASEVLGILRREIDSAMALAGCPSLAAITPDLLG